MVISDEYRYLEKFKDASKNTNRIPRTSQAFKTVMDAAKSEAGKVSLQHLRFSKQYLIHTFVSVMEHSVDMCLFCLRNYINFTLEDLFES